jgi:predicted metal-dependent peptidase
MAVNELPPEQKLAAARRQAGKLTPYFASVLLSLVPRKVDAELMPMPTIGVTKNLIMLWCEAFVKSVTVQELAAVLVHEVNHAIRSHPAQFEAAGVDMMLANIAGDLEINDDLRQIQDIVLPKGTYAPLVPEQFGFKPGKTWREYYALLQQMAKSGSSGKSGLGEGNVPGPDGKGNRAPGVGHGRCGSMGGHALDHEPGDGDADARSDKDIDRIKKETAHAVQEHSKAKGRGSVPAGLERWAEGALKPPKVRWQDKLARAARNAVAFKAGAVDLRYTRPARKQAGIGYGIGRPILPTYVAPVPRVMVAVDTSGSMGDDELRRCLAECDGVLRAVGSDIQFITCDADVHTDTVIKNWRDVAKKLNGGGGTDFRPMFTRAMSKRLRPEVLVVCTDGCGPAPAYPPPGLRVVWVLCGTHRSIPVDVETGRSITYGDIIEIDEDAA